MSTHVDLRERITELEKDVMARQAQLSELRRQMPTEPVKDYELKDSEGRSVHLSELFGERNDLILIHNMGSGCPYCTLWADGFNGIVHHLENRAAFALVSPDSPEKQKDFATGRGWRFRMLSGEGSTFTRDMGYEREVSGKSHQLPGFSTFHRGADGRIVRIAHASFGPGDPFAGIWHMFALLEGGVKDWAPKFQYSS